MNLANYIRSNAKGLAKKVDFHEHEYHCDVVIVPHSPSQTEESIKEMLREVGFVEKIYGWTIKTANNRWAVLELERGGDGYSSKDFVLAIGDNEL